MVLGNRFNNFFTSPIAMVFKAREEIDEVAKWYLSCRFKIEIWQQVLICHEYQSRKVWQDLKIDFDDEGHVVTGNIWQDLKISQ